MIDQLGHFVFGFAILLPAAKGHVWASAVLLGLFRELEQMRSAFDYDWGMNRSVDILGWLAAGLLLQFAVVR